MPSYSRNSPMPVSGAMPRITGMNAFGQPMRCNAIRGVQARHTLSGPGGGGSLSGRRYNYKEEAEAAAQRHDNEANEMASKRGREAAIQANQSTAPAKPAARQGQLVSAVGSASRWATGDELDRMDAEKAAVRKKSRKIMGYKRPVPPMTAAPMERMA